MEFVFFIILFLMVFLFCYAKTNGLDNGLYLLHRKAYKQYQKEVLEEGKSYQRYMVDFYNENVFLSVANDNRAIARLNEHNKNFHILIELLQTRRDLVTHYFGLEHFTLEDFKELNKEFNITDTVLLDEEDCLDSEEEVVEKAPEEGTPVLPVIEKVDKKEVKESSPIPIAETENPFESVLTNGQIAYLADCINDVKMFNTSVTPEELKAIFACKPKTILRSNNNRLIAFFFSGLSDRELITPNWQSVIANYQLFLSKDKSREKYINQSDLSSATNQIRDIGVEGKYTTINNYLKQVKKH